MDALKFEFRHLTFEIERREKEGEWEGERRELKEKVVVFSIMKIGRDELELLPGQ